MLTLEEYNALYNPKENLNLVETASEPLESEALIDAVLTDDEGPLPELNDKLSKSLSVGGKSPKQADHKRRRAKVT